MEFWPGVKIQRGILTPGHNSTWNSDPSTYLLPVELRLKMVSKFNSMIKIQQLRRVTIQRKIHWILTPGRYSIGGSKFYLTPPLRMLRECFPTALLLRVQCLRKSLHIAVEGPGTILIVFSMIPGSHCRRRRRLAIFVPLDMKLFESLRPFYVCEVDHSKRLGGRFPSLHILEMVVPHFDKSSE